MMRAVIYCRVSSKEQTKNLSLATQEKACRDYCKRQGFAVDKVFVEGGESAKTIARTELQKLIEYCRERKPQITYLVVYDLKRFARDRFGHYAVRALLHRFGVGLRSATEPIDDSSTGKFMEGVLAAVAQFDNDVRAERTKAGMQAAIEHGRWTFGPPLGYRKALDTTGRATIEPDPERAPLVRRAFELMATGLHAKQHARDMVTAEGLRTVRGAPVSAQTFQQMLRNPLYAAVITVPKWGPERWPGSFAPIVSGDLFGRVQAILDGKALSTTPHLRNHPDFPLRRFVRCAACEIPLTGAHSTGRAARYAYYRCRNRSCLAVKVRKADLEAAFLDYLARFAPRPEYLTLFRAIVLDVWPARHAETAEARRRLETRVAELRRREDQLNETFIYRRAIDQATYERQRDRLAEETTLAKVELHDAQLDELDVEGVLAFAEYVLANVARMWAEASLDQKQRLQRVLFPAGVTYGADGFGTAETSLVFQWLDEIAARKTSEVSPTGFEPVLPT